MAKYVVSNCDNVQVDETIFMHIVSKVLSIPGLYN